MAKTEEKEIFDLSHLKEDLKPFLNEQQEGFYPEHPEWYFEFLHKTFNFSYSELIQICSRYITYSDKHFDSFKQNIEEIIEHYKDHIEDIKELTKVFPYILLLHVSVITNKINLFKLTFNVDEDRVFKLLISYPDLMLVDRIDVIERVRFLAKFLNKHDLIIRKLFRCEPNILTTTIDHCVNIKHILNSFSFSDAEIRQMFVQAPSIMVMEFDDLRTRLQTYRETYFVKRDLKEMFSKCPEALLLDTNIVLAKVKELAKVLNIKEKAASVIIRKNPSALFRDSLTDTVLALQEHTNINLKYFSMYPELLTYPVDSLLVHLLIATTTFKDYKFMELCQIDTVLLISRMMHLQLQEKCDYDDLLLSEKEYFDKYEMSTFKLKTKYKITPEMYENMINYYHGTWKDSPLYYPFALPNYQQLHHFLYSNTPNETAYEYADISPEVLKEKNKEKYEFIENLYKKINEYGYYSREKFNFYANLDVFAMHFRDVDVPFNKLPPSLKILSDNYKYDDIIQYLLGINLTNECICKMLLQNSSFLAYNIDDLKMIMQLYIKDKEVDERNAAEFISKL